MRIFSNLSLLLVGVLLITSCSEDIYKFNLKSPKKVTFGDNITISFQQLEGKDIDSLHLYINDNNLTTTNKTTINSNTVGIGKHTITALAFLPGKVKRVSNIIEVLADKAPTIYNYKIINTYPHDAKAYTQGLEFYNGFLYETTGRNGESWLRKVVLETGEVLQQKDLNKRYFGEGMTIFNDAVYWLTWQAKK